MSEIVGPYSTAPGPRRKYKDFLLWAEDGLVFLEQQQSGEVTMLTPRRALAKLRNFSDWSDVWDKKKQNANPQERAYAIDYHAYLVNLVQVLRDTIEDAKAQGDPTDPAIRKHKFRLFMRSRQANLAGQDGSANTTAVLESMFNPTPEPIIFTPDSKWLARGPDGVDQRRG